jgi:hypothetical protein
MAKPVLVIKAKRNNMIVSNKIEELRKMAEVIVKQVGEEYHVLIVEESYEVFILNGKKVEIPQIEIEEIKRKIEEGYREIK